MRVLTATTLLGFTLAAGVPGGARSAQPPDPAPPDPASVWSIQLENASISTAPVADRDYTNGIRLGWTSAEGGAPGFLEGVGRTLWGEGRQRIAIDLSQQIYTATANTVAYPPRTDRPYAGVAMATASLIHDSTAARSVLALGIGMVGPSALGEEVQNGFHNVIGQTRTQGWDTQLHDEPLFQLTSQRTWRLPTGTLGGLDTDVLPELTAAAGNLRVYGQAGVTLRLGQGLDSDYGTARLLPGLSGTDVFRPTRPFAWYVFAGLDGQAVAYDVTLNGNAWHASRRVDLVPAVGEIEGGLAVMAYGMRWSYTQVAQTQEYQHQKGGLHQLGSFAMSVRF